MKKIKLLALATLFSSPVYAATVPADTFSRANCEVAIPWPDLGYGYYNESISFDSLTGVHKNLLVKTSQTSNKGLSRATQSSNPSGYRARAGYVDKISDTNYWNVQGSHYETLDSGRAVSFYTSATTCNHRLGQYL